MNRKPPMRGAVAGMYVVGSVLLCAAIGAGIGLLVGGIGILVSIGVLVGFALGSFSVYKRFGDL
jgi:hypothetical protein